MRELGLISPGVTAHNIVASTPEWDDLTSEEKALSARSMEVYAEMIHAIDRASVRVIDWLRENGELDNTMVIFMSDNRAEGASFGMSCLMPSRLRLDTG